MKFQFFNSPARMPAFVSARGTVATNPSPMQWYLMLALAVGSTLLSVFIAACAGWASGRSVRDRLVMAAMGVLIVSSSHVLPALGVRFDGMRRAAILGAWIGCLSYALLGQATFFALAQQDAGDARAMAVNVPGATERVDASPGRSLTVIAQDEATVTAKLESAKAVRCSPGVCRWRDARQHELEAQLTALEVEADEAKRREAREDRAARQADDARALREVRRADPVGLQAAALFGWSAASIGLFRAHLPAVMLELLPGLFWALVFAGERRVAPSARDACSDHSVTPAPAVAADPLPSGARAGAGTRAKTGREMPLNGDLATALKMAARVWEVGKSVAFLIGRRYAVRPGVDNK
ncbi:hypothetical protein [Burkholderia pseudomallei]|uniref:hypothetical protein n=1 Tax=Burkholderia pseudomallei TaxID=28450 RepID=UPI0003D7F93E|nr:hypothetical protein [Burkholderia pseudomallei]AHE29080.1 hypothetical protein BBJ_3136 [Burkholderia pseudomallei NCTC 13178]KGC48197.1 hypothetical protein DO65_3925 [Burkholderia pseudomallei]KGD52951.1 hypothetical protein DP49_75 [Burkholderia pseudomallei]